MDTIDAAKTFTRRTEDPLKENGVSTSNKSQALKISQTFLFVPFKHFKLLFALLNILNCCFHFQLTNKSYLS